MTELSKLPNIGPTLAGKLELVGITTKHDLIKVGSENAIIRLSTLDESGCCINMLYALEGAIQGIRWHELSPERKSELKVFYRTLKLK